MISRHIIRDRKRGASFRIELDPELRVFVDDLLPHCTFVEAAAECVERFGKERAPSKSAIYRYWRHQQKQT